ncbi:MAG: molybdenum cofactor guanylyltransferase [Caulobacteraceae bacterium]
MKVIDTAIILAGGRSSRMGFDKQFLKLKEKYLIEALIDKLRSMFSEIVIVTNRPDRYVKYNCIIAEDEVQGFGPVAGIHAGLKKTSSLYNYIIACDMPFINREYIRYMKGLIMGHSGEVDAVITRLGEWIEPFNAFYSKRLIDRIEVNMQKGYRQINSLFSDSTVLYVEEAKAREYSPDWDMFANLNTMKDYKAALGKMLQE